MTSSRRELFKAASMIALAAASSTALAQQPGSLAAPTAEAGGASTQDRDIKIVNFELLEEEARKHVAPPRFAFLGPAGEGVTYRENRRAFNDFPIYPRRLQGIEEKSIDLRTRLLGHDLPFPMIVAPMGSHGMMHVGAEVATATGTGASGALYVSSGAANNPMEDIAKATPAPKWFQIYMNRDMEINRWLVQRAKAAGFSAIVLTADALGPNQSDEYVRLGSFRAPNLRQGNHDPALGGRGTFPDFKRDLNFGDIGFLRESSGLPVVVKGLLNVEDVREAIASGAGAVWISNHGGRQIDGVPASITMLRPAADAVEGRVPIVFDSGIRRGTDVFKAVALGATVVAVGRPVLWALAAGGPTGVRSVFPHLAAELKSAMLLSGTAKISDISRKHVIVKA